MKNLLLLPGAVFALILSSQAATVYTTDFAEGYTSSGSGAHVLGGITPNVTATQWFGSTNGVSITDGDLTLGNTTQNRFRGAGVWLDTSVAGWDAGTVTVEFEASNFAIGIDSEAVFQVFAASGVDASNSVSLDLHGAQSIGAVTATTGTASIAMLGSEQTITGSTAATPSTVSLTFSYNGTDQYIGLVFANSNAVGTGTGNTVDIDNLSVDVEATPPSVVVKPNIILFYVDDLGWQDVQLNDLDDPCPYETPNLVALAEAGMNFSQAYSPAPTCAPSRGAIISGQHPAKTRFTHVTTNDTGADDSDELLTNTYIDKQLDPTILTTADALRANGYSTGHSGKWHVGLTAASYGFDTVNHSRGVHRGMNPNRNAASAFGGADSTYPLSTEKYAPTSEAYPDGISYPYDVLTESALQFIEDEKDQPFFLQVWHWMVHYPIVTRNEDLLKYYCTKFGHNYPPAIDDDEWTTPGQQNPYFASMVTTVDWSLGRLVDYLTITDDPRHPGKKLIETTYIVFTSDNGGAEVRGAEIISENEPLKGKKGYVTDGGIRVPMVFSGPEIAAGSEFHTIVNQLDYFPTFLSLTDTTIAQADEDELCGADLEPILHGTSTQIIEPTTMQEREYLFWHFPHTGTLGMYAALRSGDYKIHKSFKTGIYELYRLTNNGVRTDIEEAVDLAADPAYAAKLNELTAMLEGALLSKNAEIPYLNPNYTGVDPATLAETDSDLFNTLTREAQLTIDETGPKLTDASVIYLTPILDPGDNEVVTEQYMGGVRQPADLSADGYNVSAVIPEGIDSYCYMLVDENGFMQYTNEVTSPVYVPPAGIIAHWPLDENSGSQAADVSGNGHHATVTGADWSVGVSGGALYFDGINNDTAAIPEMAVSGLDGQISIAMWAYGGATQPAQDAAFFAADVSGGKLLNIHLPWSNSNVFWDAGASDRISATASGDEIKGKWNHWVFTKNAVGMTIYLNGARFHDETGKTESMAGITQAWFGGSNGLGAASYEGLLDDVILYDGALSDAEVATLYGSYTLPADYSTWLLDYPGLSDTTFEGDPEQDGIATGLEFVLNGTPTGPDQILLPVLDATGANFVFTFTRSAEAVPFTEQTFQYTSNLSSWTEDDLNITEPRASEVSLGSITGGLQAVTVTIPKSLAMDGKLFGRLKVLSVAE